MSRELDPEQQLAVSAPAGMALVLAGAGSGKTRTLTHRVAHLLATGEEPASVLLLTFTNRAAREMLERVERLVPGGCAGLWGGTFHSVAHRLLRRHAAEVGIHRAFSILDRDDQRSMLRRVREAVLGDTRDLPGCPGPGALAEIIGLSASAGCDVATMIGRRFAHLEGYRREIVAVADAYAARKREGNGLDFDDLLVEAVRLLEGHADVGAIYRRRFRHILVDEYQDTNPIQCRMVRALAGEEASVMVVGDDAQSIYSWRGAEPRAMREFLEWRPGTRVYPIANNYRSVAEIIDVANAVMAEGCGVMEKRLRSVRGRCGRRPELWEVPDGATQATRVADSLLALRYEGWDLSDAAVLYRSHHHSLELQVELARRRIPYRLTSGVRFFEQAHVKDVTSFLRFAANPDDGVALARVARLVPGIGEKTAERVRADVCAAARAGGAGAALGEALRAAKVPRRAEASWSQMAYTFDELRPGSGVIDPGSMIRIVLEAVYDDHLRAEYPDRDERRADLERLSEFACGYADAAEFLAEVALLGGDDADPDDGGGASGDAVTLSTVHQAKGLEWRAVYLIWMVEGMFPTRHSAGRDAALEEERRLFYVGVTRARDRLVLGVPRYNTAAGSTVAPVEPSRFVGALGAEIDRRG